MKVAVLKTGGKQYLVEEGSKIEIEKIKDIEKKMKENGDKNPEIVFQDILLYADDNQILIGKPRVENVNVVGKLIREKKTKTLILKYKPKTRYRKKKGYKKITWIVQIEKINLER